MKKIIPVVLVVAALVGASLWIDRKPVGPLVVSGYVEADQIRLGSRVGGRVAAVHVAEGDRVARGAKLVELEPYDLNELREAAAAEAAVREARHAELVAGFRPEDVAAAAARRDALGARHARLVKGPRSQEIDVAQARLESARAAHELARIELDRVRELVEKGVGTPDELDRVRARLDSSVADRHAREAELALLREGSRPEDLAEAKALLEEAEHALARLRSGYRVEEIAQAKAAHDAARAQLAAVERRLAELIITAPLDGDVEAIELDPGDLVLAGAPVIELLDPGHLWVRAYVPEDRLDVRIGDPVDVAVDSFPGETFRGKIAFLSRRAEFVPGNVQTPEERSKQVFRIKVVLVDGRDRLRPGMAADLTFPARGEAP